MGPEYETLELARKELRDRVRTLRPDFDVSDDLQAVAIERKRRRRVKTMDHEAWDEDGRAGKTLHLGTNQTIVWLLHAPTSPAAIGTLAHEALHAIVQIFKTIPMTADNDEVYAYAVEHVVEEVLNDFRK